MAAKKLTKEIKDKVITITEGTTGTAMAFDFSSLPANIQAKLGPFGLGHKLGDAAAGKEGQEAVDSVNKVFDGLKAGDWSVRAPAGPKVSKKDMTEKLSSLSEAEQEAAKALLAKLGVIL